MLNWEDGRLFLAVARAGQLLGAARALGVSQSTLSRRMTALEQNLGTKLLIRRTTGCDLTETGEAFVRTLEQIESTLLAGEDALAGRESTLSGTVRLGAPDGFGVSFVAPRLAALSERHPGLTIQLVPVPRSFSLSQREADIAVIVGRPEQGRLIGRRLVDYSLSLYASADYLAANPAPESAADLERHRLIGYVEDLIYAPSLAYTSEFARRWRSRIEIASVSGQLEAARAGAGIAILHDYLAAPHAELKLVLPELRVVRGYWIVYHESMRDNARVRAVAAFLAEAVKQAGTPFLRR